MRNGETKLYQLALIYFSIDSLGEFVYPDEEEQ